MIKLFILLSLACTVNIQINDKIDERPLLSRKDAMMCNHEAFDILVVKNQYSCVMSYLEEKRRRPLKIHKKASFAFTSLESSFGANFTLTCVK